MKKIASLTLVLCLLCGLLAGCGQKSDPAAPGANTQNGEGAEATAKVAIVFGALGDLNFNDWCWEGICQARDELGIEFNYVECATVSEAATQIDAFAGDALYDLIIVVGSDRGEAMQEIAQAYPEQKFALIDAGVDESLENCVGIRADYPQWQFLSGCLAGMATVNSAEFPLANDENKVGFVGGADTFTSRAGAAGFLAGVKYVNPTCELLYSIVGSYTDPTTAKEIALTMYGAGADVLSVNCGSSANGVLAAAEESNRYFCSTSPALVSETNQLCISITRFDTFVVKAVEMVLDNTWESGTHIYGIADGACEISFDKVNIQIPEETKAVLEDIQKKITAGEIVFPEDPNDIEQWAQTYSYQK